MLLTSCVKQQNWCIGLSVIFFRLAFLNIYILWNFFRKNMFPKSIYMELKNWTHLTLKQRQAINSSKLLCFSLELCIYIMNTMMTGDSVVLCSKLSKYGSYKKAKHLLWNTSWHLKRIEKRTRLFDRNINWIVSTHSCIHTGIHIGIIVTSVIHPTKPGIGWNSLINLA